MSIKIIKLFASQNKTCEIYIIIFTSNFINHIFCVTIILVCVKNLCSFECSYWYVFIQHIISSYLLFNPNVIEINLLVPIQKHYNLFGHWWCDILIVRKAKNETVSKMDLKKFDDPCTKRS